MKIKTCTLTWIHNGNYGTMLQAYALQKVLELNGYENVIIDYKPGKLMKVINLFTSGNSLKLFYYKFRGFLDSIEERKSKKSELEEVISRNDCFDIFVRESLKTTDVFRTPRELKKLRGKYDAYICGSDQIWNPGLLNPPYFFSFLSDEDKRVAYGPSFGVTSIGKKKKNRIKGYLSKFSALSVREPQGVGIFEDMGFDTQKTPVVLDPTMLIEKQEWQKFTQNTEAEGEPYILCYFLHDNPTYWKAVDRLKSELNCKVIVVPIAVDAYKSGYDIRQNTSPQQWVRLVSNAEFVLTDSYHCVLFSLISHSNFYVFKRFEDNDPESQNSRIDNILDKAGLGDRFLSRSAELTEIKAIDDFSAVDKMLEEQRAESLSYLKNAIDL